jgi:hypothetical protein
MSDIGLASTSQVRTSYMSLLLLVEIKDYGFKVVSSNMIFMPHL